MVIGVCDVAIFQGFMSWKEAMVELKLTRARFEMETSDVGRRV